LCNMDNVHRPIWMFIV